MTTQPAPGGPTAPDSLLADVTRQRRRTRRLIDSNWFTFAVLGAALTVGGLLPDRWGWLLAAAMVAAYAAIAWRWHRVARTFSWGPGSTSIQLTAFALSAAIAVGDWAWGTQLHHTAATIAVSLWSSLGMVAFWRLTRTRHCLTLAVICLAVGVLGLTVTGLNEDLAYGIGFLLWAVVHWVRLGRSTR